MIFGRPLASSLLVPLLGIFLFSSGFAFGAETQLKMIASSEIVYTGEPFSAQFVFSGPGRFYEVEVAKFPEFRGFWMDNQTLRQGPVALAPIPSRGQNEVLIGAYTLTAMLGRKITEIRPMKLVVKDPTRPGFSEVIESELPAITIRPLPPPPDAQVAKLFSGAVGVFSIMAHQTQIPYSKDAPAWVQISIGGMGNYPDIRSVSLELPENAEITSARASFSGGPFTGSKTFNYVIQVNSENTIEVPGPQMAYFSLKTKRYEILSSPPFSFIPIAAPTESGTSTQDRLWDPPIFRSPQSWWNRLPSRWLFWGAQIGFFCIWLIWVRPWNRIRFRGAPSQHSLIWKKVAKLKKTEMNARSARLIIEYLEALLRQLAPNQETRARRLAQISKDGPSIAAHEIQLLIEQLEGYLYNPLHTPSLQDLPMEKLNWIRKNSTRRNV